jgi:eukaryotic-like serine/threonine-protein kinase
MRSQLGPQPRKAYPDSAPPFCIQNGAFMFEKLGRFEIKGLLGRGAMGEVYLGIDPALGREVAIKTILATAAQGEDAKLRFAREARAAGVLNHPNIVTIYEFGEDQGVLFIAMERVRGQDLEEMLRQRSITAGEALEVLAQVCDGLEFAHRNNVIHRDIKPSNVRVLRDGRRIQAKVMDFGVARLKDSEMTATGTVVGTVSYMAPEYIRTGKPDGRSDLFAVGVMLYECISGRRPFEGDTTPTILYKIVNEPPDPVDLSQLKEISPAIRSVLDKALAKDPDQRYQTADDFAHALRAAKDPTWQGQVKDATIRIEARTQASTLRPPEIPSNAAPTAALKAPPTVFVQPKPAGSSRALIAAGLGVVVLGALGGGGFLAYRVISARKAALAIAEEPAAVKPQTLPPPKPTKGNPKPLAQATPVPTPPVQAAPQVPPQPQSTPQAQVLPQAKPQSRPQLPPPVITENPPEPKPAPEPPVAQGLPPQEQKNVANVSLSEAIRLADSDPARAIEGLRKVIAVDPGNPNAYAWLAVILYEQGRYQEIPAVLAKARQHGIPRARLLSNMRFKMIVQNDRLNHRIPGGTGADE